MIREFEEKRPAVPSSAYVDETALLIGDVTLGEDVSVWPTAVLRGDVNRIMVGDRTSIQDGVVVHVTHDGPFTPGGVPTVIGTDVTVGHRALLHGCTIESVCLVGMGAILMDEAVVRSEVIVAAGSVVPPGKELVSGYLYVGAPVRKVRPLSAREREQLLYSAEHYVRLKNRHLSGKPAAGNACTGEAQ